DHQLKVVANDCAGHTTEKIVRFAIDRTAPQLLSIIPQSGSMIGTKPVITGTASPDATTITLAGQSAPVTNGAFSISDVRQADAVGHSSQATVTFTIDTTPPQVKITAPDSGATFTTDVVEVRGTVSADATFVSVNGMSATIANGAFVVTVPLDAGPNDIAAIA